MWTDIDAQDAWVSMWRATALRYRNRNTARPEAKVMTVEDMQVERLLDEL